MPGAPASFRVGLPATTHCSILFTPNVTGQVPGKQTLSWRVMYGFPGDRTHGGVKEVRWGRVRNWALSRHSKSLGFPHPNPHPQELPVGDGPAGSRPGGLEGLPLCCAFTSHWMQAASGKWGNLGEGGSLQPAKDPFPPAGQTPVPPTAARCSPGVFLGPAPLSVLPTSPHLPGLVMMTPHCRLRFPSQKSKEEAPSSTPSPSFPQAESISEQQGAE